LIKKIVREWLSKASEDLQFAGLNLEEGRNFFPQICFHLQQSAGKFLKAFIIAHDLQTLLKICESKEPALRQLQPDCDFLSPFYVDARYPLHWPTHFSPEETQKAFQAAQRIRSLIEEKLSSYFI
jgi:HEPN domain-containing protein